MSDVDPFAGVPPELQATLRARGFERLTPVQQAVLRASSEGRNVRLSSVTGSGKTVAAGLVLAPDLLLAARADEARRGPLALVIAPTRELAAQVRDELTWLFAQIAGFATAVVTGGTDMGKERRALGKKPHLLVATPGRLLDHMRAGNVDFMSLRHVVLDEADRMLDMGFKDELDAIIEALPESRHSHLMSATFPPDVRRLADTFQHDALAIEGTRPGAANRDIEHTVYVVRQSDRYDALVNCLLLLGDACTLVFVPRRHLTTDIAERLAKDGFSAMPFSGELTQAQRTRTLNAFRSGLVSILVATDVAARGIDVSDLSAVIHMDVPRRAEDYVHRSGRTGRAGNRGRSLSIVTPRERRALERVLQTARIEADWPALPSAKKIERLLRKRWRKELHERIAEDGAAPSDANLEYARRLLDGRDAAPIVAHLLDMVQPDLPRRPVDVGTAPSRAPGRRPDRGGAFVPFDVTWGSEGGATPARLLAHVCRRGDIGSEDVGAIRIGPRRSTVEVAERVADAFAGRAEGEDERGEGIRISRAKGPPRTSTPRSPRRLGGKHLVPGKGRRKGRAQDRSPGKAYGGHPSGEGEGKPPGRGKPSGPGKHRGKPSGPRKHPGKGPGRGKPSGPGKARKRRD